MELRVILAGIPVGLIDVEEEYGIQEEKMGY